ncbi:Derlin 1 [Sparganum proliferum]
MVGNDFSDVYYGIPRLTRYWLTGTVVLSLLGKLGLISLFWLILEWNKFFYDFQLWRPVTALLFYPVTPQTGFHFLINLYFLYTYSSRLETGSGRPAEYAFLLLVNWITLTVIGFLMGFYLLFEPMVLSVMYVWCQMNREAVVQFWFGTQFKAIYFPWALVVFNIIIRGSALMELVGIFVGHVYYFFAHQYPQEFGGPQLLKTPAFLYRLLPSTRGIVSGFGIPPPQMQRDSGSRGFPGRGNVLGRDN